MTVENKFKRNVLAASILVGLSLSAASGVAWAEGESALQMKGESEALSADTNADAGDTGKNSEVQSAESLATIKDDALETLSSGDKLSEGSPGNLQEGTNPQNETSTIKNENDEIKSDEKKEGDTSEQVPSEADPKKADLNAEQQDAPVAHHEDSESLNGGKGDEDKSLIEKVGDGLNNLVNAAADLITGGGASTPEDNKEGGGQALSDGAEDNSQPSAPVSPSAEGGDRNVQSPGDSEAGHATEPDKQPELDGKPVVDDGSEPGKQPELDGKPVVDGGSEPDKQPELDGKPVVDDGSEPGKQPELDGKPVVDDGSEPGKQPELDGKPVVDDGSESGKQPELDGKPVVDDGTESDKQPEVGSKPAPVEKPVAEKPAEQPAVKPAEPRHTYSAAELNALTKDKALTEALPIDVSPSATDTKAVVYSLGDAASKDGKVTPSSIRAESAVAVDLTGTLRTAQPELDKDGKPVAGKVVRDADKIILQNINIQNRVNEFVSDIAGIRIGTQTASDTGASSAAPKDASILLDNVNITMQNDSGRTKAIDLTGNSNHLLAKGGVIDAGEGYSASVLDISGSNNVVDFVGSTLKGDIKSEWSPSGTLDNTVNLKGSKLTGNAVSATGNLNLVLDGSTWTGGAGLHSPDVSLRNGSVWNVTGTNGVWSDRSSVNSLNLYGSNTVNLVSSVGLAQLGGHGFTGENTGKTLHVDTDLKNDGKGVTTVNVGTYSPGTLHRLNNTGLGDDYAFGRIEADGLALGGKYRLNVESSGAEPYTIGGRLADGAASKAHAFVEYKTSENRPGTDKDGKPVTLNVKSDADFISLSAPTELGVYQYAAEKVIDGVNNRTSIYYTSTGKLSNSAATAVSMAAAPVDVANLESDTLAKHMNSVRHGKDSGVWLSYFGGENRNTTAAGPEYTLKTNGVMLGADTLTENNWLAGVAVSSARSDVSVMNSSGDLNSYGAQFYMSRRYDSGVFVDSALQFNHFSNTAKARMINGQQAKADFSGNSYGLEAKVGYAWNDNGFFAEPYVRAAARAFDGEHYALSNGMTVNSNDYKSMLGEVGADVGYQYDLSGGYVKPYLHLAALNEFADGNSVRVNNVSLDNSVKGAAFQAGLGAEVKVTDNLGGYAAFDYTKGDNTERPWQATVGVNYTW
ncbi:autotransporter outer membrane beta-barrel domain-containing protein [Salmonella enterica]|nr:autotransporter outer membrane beta-barrel domain-containing protein [Salmonella enterica]EAB9739999.1 autotransporter outer membrane beta-barrel domain-containing protein [Salmonella enterica subsp. diarizonae]HCM1847762.1 autotransporter outer membrane beta-barrel domain-containing protein [Salmonella enterica subsp. diarizonae serovar 16:z10:e,n,x,z15]EAX7749196.1 autotransporter outer membrane beta-barrel domain-containing protein [Salmonella enterica]EAX7763274.1 autotransporter outer m